MMAGSYITDIPAQNKVTVSSTYKSSSDVRIRDIKHCLVGCDDQTIKYADIYGGKLDKNLQVNSAADSVCLALSPHGDFFKVGYGANQNGWDAYKTYGDRTSFDAMIGTSGWYGFSMLMTDSYATNLIAKLQIDAVSVVNNGYWAPNIPQPTGLAITNFQDMDVPLNWVAQAVISLNKGGLFDVI